MSDADQLESRQDPRITVFLLDDHELILRGVRKLLESEGDIEVIGESGSAAEAVARIPVLRPDVAVLDERLPDGTGVEVCREIRSVDPRIAVLMLTGYDDDDALFAAIMAGASGFVLKQISGADIVNAVRRVAAGQSLLDPAVTGRVLAGLRSLQHTDVSAPPPHTEGGADPRAPRSGNDQPTDRRTPRAGGEDREELRVHPAGQVGNGEQDAGRGPRGQSPTRAWPCRASARG